MQSWIYGAKVFYRKLEIMIRWVFGLPINYQANIEFNGNIFGKKVLILGLTLEKTVPILEILKSLMCIKDSWKKI